MIDKNNDKPVGSTPLVSGPASQSCPDGGERRALADRRCRGCGKERWAVVTDVTHEFMHWMCPWCGTPESGDEATNRSGSANESR